MARKRKGAEQVPSYNQLMIPVLDALITLGGSGTIEEINEKVYEIKNFSENVLQIPHKEDSSRSEVDYRLAWARTYLKKFGLLENSSRGVWTLTTPEIDTRKLDAEDIVRQVEVYDSNQPVKILKQKILGKIWKRLRKILNGQKSS